MLSILEKTGPEKRLRPVYKIPGNLGYETNIYQKTLNVVCMFWQYEIIIFQQDADGQC